MLQLEGMENNWSQKLNEGSESKCRNRGSEVAIDCKLVQEVYTVRDLDQ